MSKALFILLLVIIILLAVACRGRTPVWQETSSTPPNFEEQPQLLLLSKSDSSQFSLFNINNNEMSDRQLDRSPSLAPLIASDYQVIDSILVGEDGRYFDLPNGEASPNGLWITSIDNAGLSLFRVDGSRMLLSENGRFPIWSNDGQWLAYADNEGLWAIKLSNLMTTQLSTSSSEPLAWSEDNQQLLLRREESAIIFDIVTKEERTLRGIDATQFQAQPVWNEDGSTIYASYGNNGNTDSVPKKIQARLIAIDISNERATVRNLLPNVRNQGITTFLPSPDKKIIFVRFHVCRNEFGGLFPFIPTRQCDNSHLLVEGATGDYTTLPTLPTETTFAWERPFSAVTLAALPQPTASSSGSADDSTLPSSTSFWQPNAELGHNPATAVPLGQAQSNGEGGKLLSVVEIVSSEDALTLALNANGAPPLPGYTYFAVRQRIAREAGRSSIFLTPRTHLVDSQLVAHQEILWLNAEGQKITELEYSDENPAEYWQVFALAEDAQPWLLFASAGIADNLPDLYFRLDENDEWEMPSGAESIPTNSIGVSEPAQIGETAVSTNWQLTVLDSTSHDLGAAFQDFVKVRIVYTGSIPSVARLLTCLSHRDFSGVGSTQIGQIGTNPSQPLQSLYHQPCFLPGAVYEGWITAVTGASGEPITFRFAPLNQPNDPFSGRVFENK